MRMIPPHTAWAAMYAAISGVLTASAFSKARSPSVLHHPACTTAGLLPIFQRDACSSFPRTILRTAKPKCPSSHQGHPDSFHSLPQRPDRHTDTLQRLLSPSQWSTLVAVVHHPTEPFDRSRGLCLLILLTTQAPADHERTAQGIILPTSTHIPTAPVSSHSPCPHITSIGPVIQGPGKKSEDSQCNAQHWDCSSLDHSPMTI